MTAALARIEAILLLSAELGIPFDEAEYIVAKQSKPAAFTTAELRQAKTWRLGTLAWLDDQIAELEVRKAENFRNGRRDFDTIDQLWAAERFRDRLRKAWGKSLIEEYRANR